VIDPANDLPNFFLEKSHTLEQFSGRNEPEGKPQPLPEYREMRTLRDLLTGWPSRQEVAAYLDTLEAQLLSERAAAEQQERSKLEGCDG
jgi:MoxR-like ATPase